MQFLEGGNRSDNILKNINFCLQIQMVLRVLVMKTQVHALGLLSASFCRKLICLNHLQNNSKPLQKHSAYTWPFRIGM